MQDLITLENLDNSELNRGFCNISQQETEEASSSLLNEAFEQSKIIKLLSAQKENIDLFQEKFSMQRQVSKFEEENPNKQNTFSRSPTNLHKLNISSIKKDAFDWKSNLNDSEIKQLKSICIVLDEKNKENQDTTNCNATFIKYHNMKKVKRIVEDEEFEKKQTEASNQKQSFKQNQDKGNFPELPKGQSSEKMHIKQYKHQILKQIGQSMLQDTCPICLRQYIQNKQYEEKANLVLLDPCDHIMCKDCILEWARKYKSNCPICRREFHNIWPLKWVSDMELEQEETPVKFTPNSKQWVLEEDDFYFEPDGSDDKCQVCHRQINFHLMLICDECNYQVCHTYCDPSLKANRIPDDEWYCMKCRSSPTAYNISSALDQQIRKVQQRKSKKKTNVQGRETTDYMQSKDQFEAIRIELNHYQYRRSNRFRQQQSTNLHIYNTRQRRQHQ